MSAMPEAEREYREKIRDDAKVAAQIAFEEAEDRKWTLVALEMEAEAERLKGTP